MSIVTDPELFKEFASQENLTVKQRKAFEQYMHLLLERNEDMNLTAIVQPRSIIAGHFRDSLAVGHYIDMNSLRTVADVGSGGGFPGIPLKIAYPHLFVILIEVTYKKVLFLQEVIEALGLENIAVCQLDWRTFLRKTNFAIDLFCSRASLDVPELARMFKPSCVYNTATLVYWASQHWIAEPEITPFLEKEVSYKLGSKQRKLVFLKQYIAQPLKGVSGD